MIMIEIRVRTDSAPSSKQQQQSQWVGGCYCIISFPSLEVELDRIQILSDRCEAGSSGSRYPKYYNAMYF